MKMYFLLEKVDIPLPAMGEEPDKEPCQPREANQQLHGLMQLEESRNFRELKNEVSPILNIPPFTGKERKIIIIQKCRSGRGRIYVRFQGV